MKRLGAAPTVWRSLGLVGLLACSAESPPPAVSAPGPAPRCSAGDTLTCECYDGALGNTICISGTPGPCECADSEIDPDDEWDDGWEDGFDDVGGEVDDDTQDDEPATPRDAGRDAGRGRDASVVPGDGGKPRDGGASDAGTDLPPDPGNDDGGDSPDPAPQASCLEGSSADYKAAGPYRVKTKDVDLGAPLGTYTLYYPEQPDASCGHPIVAWGNGTGVTGSTVYAHLHRHAASWGIVVMASHNANVARGAFLDGAIDYLLKEDGNAESELHGKLSDRAGVAGHSQGGFAATASSHPKVVAAVNIEGGGRPDPKVALLCETGAKDSARESCTQSYNAASGPSFLADHQEADHVSTPTALGARTPAGIEFTRLYTAWWRCFLAGDGTACKLFEGGKDAPVCKQSTWATCGGKNMP